MNKERDVWTAAALFATIGFMARAVRYAREHGDERLNLARFIICTLSASAVSVLIGWTLDGLGVSYELSLAAVGAVGYVGGPLLDLLYDEVLDIAKLISEKVKKSL